MYSTDRKYVKECKLGGDAWDISYHKKSGGIVVGYLNVLFQITNFLVDRRLN
jgi:hypothetical protein